MSEKKPNILIFMTDHQRFDTVPPFNRAITPNINRFHENAVSFTSVYCPSPHCCPSRATFFSGLYPSEHGVWNNVNVGNRLSSGPYEGTRMWSQDLHDAGYKMFFAGKWHVNDEAGPGEFGFDTVRDYMRYHKKPEYYSMPDNYEWDAIYTDFEKMKNTYEKIVNLKGRTGDGSRLEGQLTRKGYPTYTFYGVKDNPFNDRRVINDGMELLNECLVQDDPWCLYVGPSGPHDPYYVPQRFLDLYKDVDIDLPDSFEDDLSDKPSMYRRLRIRYSQMTREENLECLKHYLAFCSYEDSLFGEIYDRLLESGRLKDTLVLYLSDHGDYAGDHGLWAKGLPCFDGAYHIPMIAGGYDLPAKKAVCDEFVSLADIAPTLLDMAGIACEPGRFSGKSMMPLLYGDIADWSRDAIYTQTNGNELYGIQRSVMTRKWKYIYNGFDFDELYDLENDPSQMHNLADLDEHDSIQKELSILMWKFAHEHKDVCINPYIMVSLAKYGPGVAFGWE